MNAADTARSHNWVPGTVLAGWSDGHDGWGAIHITAVGDTTVLAVQLAHQGHPITWVPRETSWTLDYRDWFAVTPPTGPDLDWTCPTCRVTTSDVAAPTAAAAAAALTARIHAIHTDVHAAQTGRTER